MKKTILASLILCSSAISFAKPVCSITEDGSEGWLLRDSTDVEIFVESPCEELQMKAVCKNKLKRSQGWYAKYTRLSEYSEKCDTEYGIKLLDREGYLCIDNEVFKERITYERIAYANCSEEVLEEVMLLAKKNKYELLVAAGERITRSDATKLINISPKGDELYLATFEISHWRSGKVRKTVQVLVDGEGNLVEEN